MVTAELHVWVCLVPCFPVHFIHTTGLRRVPAGKVGDPRQLIVATAEALGVDLLVIGAHSKRRFLDVLLGGTATAVSRHAPCTVVMVQPGEKRPLVQTSTVGKILQAATPG